MSKIFTSELEGQKDFYGSYLKLVDKNLSMDEILSDNTDGVLRGNLIEFKLNINNLNSVLFQAIKYLSVRRIKGKPVPANIILISLNEGIAYVYNSFDYLVEIETIYMGGASKNNTGFSGKSPKLKLYYKKNATDQNNLIVLLRTEKYTKIHIDENNIVGWATNYYKAYPNATKADFIGESTDKGILVGEIRSPNKFKDYIYPYKNNTNAKFNYLMDRLNDDLQKKNLGAFYTHDLYAKKTLELVREAIKRVPKGNDYTIIDRCAGTGNLEMHMTDEELKHTVVSTLEYYEYKVLLELLSDKVKYIIPPIEEEDTFNMGLVRGADALSKEFIENEIIKSYVDDEKMTIILLENPPYAETTSIEHQKKKASKKSSQWKESYVVQKMKEDSSVKGATSNDMGNVFIWSAFKYYLRQPTDSYIVYSPVKYWKVQNLVFKNFIKGFAFNRKHFHTNTNACIMVALWSNEDDSKTDSIKLRSYDIIEQELKQELDLDVKKIKNSYSTVYFDKRKFSDDEENGIWCELNGKEADSSKKKDAKSLYNDNIVGYMAVYSSGFDNPDLHSSLLRAARYDGHGFFLRNDNYLEKLPMFSASRYIRYNAYWTERARIMKSADGADNYYRDLHKGKIDQVLLKNLLFTCLEPQNHMKTFVGSDRRFYRNELCLDNTNGDTLASSDLKKMKMKKEEKILMNQWLEILRIAKGTDNYDPNNTYGVFQIEDELNTFDIDPNTDSRVYHYPELNGQLKTLKELVKKYYLSEIVPFLFKYEFLK